MLQAIRSALGVWRSYRVYYGDKARDQAMDALHGHFVKPGDIAFDIGAHVGDRVASFRRLGCRVVAVEPQPALQRALKWLYGRDRHVVLERLAVGPTAGRLELKVNVRNPTVTTASDAFIKAADGAAGWEGQRWDKTIEVPVVTLDDLIARHGRPAFIKIDVEGFEDDVLAGLSAPVPALSFEFTTIQRDVAYAVLSRLARLGDYRFDMSIGETQTLLYGVSEGRGLDAEAMREAIVALPHAANSGDVYAVLR